MIKDFIVNISRQTTAVQQAGFGLVLVFDSTQEVPYAEYTSIADVAEDYAVTDTSYKIAAKLFSQNPAPASVAMYGTVCADETAMVAALTALQAEHDDWYGLCADDNATATVQAIAAYAASAGKMYAVTTQVLTDASAVTEDVVIGYHDNAEDFFAEGLLGYMLTVDIGSYTAKAKTVVGSVASDITVSELNTLHDDGGISYIESMGVLQTSEGFVASGEYLDVVLGEAWIKARMEEEYALLMVNSPKIPYSNAGIGLLVGVATKVLKAAANRGIVLVDEDEPQFTVTYIAREDVPANDIANRTYDYVKWEAVLAGAIHDGTISGTLTL